MPRGQPDYGQFQPKTVGGTLSDMADLAVRLGSIVEYDRRGDIVFLDDFEELIRKWASLGTPGNAGVLDSTIAKSGSQSVKFTTTAFLGDNVILTKSFVVLGVLRVGIEISLADLAIGFDFYFRIAYWDGTTGRQAHIWYDNSTTSFFVEDTVAGNWTLIANVGAMRLLEELFYPIKLVADFTTNRYVRFLFGNTEHDISTIVIPPIVLAGGAYLRTRVQVMNAVAVVHTAWIDDFILTQNEP